MQLEREITKTLQKNDDKAWPCSSTAQVKDKNYRC